ncbi:MAG: Rrf2 family transcriptional regulator [Bacteroidia bacterium]|nr:Rrf2 family transcriptional regulator [Bacteroidia bacterium]
MLSKRAKYGISSLVYLAKHYNEGPVLISDISKNQKLPRKFLEAILLDMKNHGILGSKKGRKGGYYLARPPHEVSIAEVIRLLNGAIGLLPCTTFQFYERCSDCNDEKTCGIRDVFIDVRNSSVQLLKENSLQSILDREDNLTKAIQQSE